MKTMGYSTRVATDAPLDSSKYKSPRDFTVAKYDYTASAAWATATGYVVGNVRKNGAAGYRCILNHTSGAANEPGMGADWETYWERLGDNVLALSGLPSQLTTPGIDISFINAAYVFHGGVSPAHRYNTVEDKGMRWDDTNKFLWIPDDVTALDVFRVEIDGPSRVKIEVDNLEVQLEMKSDDTSEKSDGVLTGSTIDHSVPATGNLSPAAKPYHIDAEGRQTAVGYAPSGGVEENDAPLKMAGGDYAGTKASLTTTLGVANAELVHTAVKAGPEGNAITMEYADGGAGASLEVDVTGTAITVIFDLAAASVTALEVLDAINADPYVRVLENCELAPGNDGSGLIIVMAAAALAGGLGHSHVNEIFTDGQGRQKELNAETIASAVTDEGAAAPTKGMAVHEVGSAATPAPVADGEAVKPWNDNVGRRHTVVDSALDPDNDIVSARPLPATQLKGEISWTSSATIGNTTVLSGTSSTGRRFRLSADPEKPAVHPVDYFFCIGSLTANGSMISAAGVALAGIKIKRVYQENAAGEVLVDICESVVVELDNLSKAYGACSAVSQKLIISQEGA